MAIVLSVAVASAALAQTLPVSGSALKPAAAASWPQPSPAALTNALRQIAALEAEVAALPPAQQKIASVLREAHREHAGLPKHSAAPYLASGLKPSAAGEVVVDIEGTISTGLLSSVGQAHGKVLSQHPQYHTLRARLPLAALAGLAQRPEVKFIHPADLGGPNVGGATSEGDVAHQANVVRSTYGATGAGIKVGLLSDSLNGLAVSQSHGDLGTVYIVNGQDGLSGPITNGEGTAMLEIVHDLAPDAQLYFASAQAGPAAMAANILALADLGCRVIVDDWSFYREAPFQDDVLAQAVQTVSSRGVLFFSSAGNSGNLDSGTSGTWEGDFAADASDPRYGGGVAHNWGGSIFNPITQIGNDFVLYWADPMGASTNNYNLFITDAAGNVVRSSVTVQTGAQDPVEEVLGVTTGQYVVVTLASGASRFLRLDTNRGQLGYGTAGNTRGHNASGAANAFCVAASSALGMTGPFTGGAANPVETFSSDGYRRIFFQADGTPITPGNFSSSGGRVLLKPDITAADAVNASTTFPNDSGFHPFLGTSAAAPHAAAIAALLLSYRPDLSPAQVRHVLTNTALNIQGPGFDRDSGYGIIMADRAVAALNPTVAFTSPAPGGVLSQASCSGTAAAYGTTVSVVRIALSRSSDGVWYNFAAGTWGTTTFDWNTDFETASGTAAWTAMLPTIPDGAYQLHAQVVDAFNHGSDWQTLNFTRSVDKTPPSILTLDSIASGQVLTTNALPGLFGTAVDPESGIGAVTVYLMRLESGGFVYWSGASWTATPSALQADYASLGSTWQVNGSLPSGSALANGTYQVQVSAANGESPPGTRGIGVSFVVDYHPVCYWTAGSCLDNNSNNDNNRWDDPANWSPYGVPSSDAVVVIGGSAPAWPDNTALGSVSIYCVNLSSGSLTTHGMFIRKLNVSGGTLAGGAINIDGNGGVFNWTGGTLAGTFGILTGAVVNVSGEATKVLADNALLVNQGTLTWTGGGPIAANSYNAPSTITNAPGASFLLAGDGSVFGQVVGYQGFNVNNAAGARFAKTAGANSTVSACTFNNAGELGSDTGKLDFNATVNLAPGTRFTGNGTHRLTGSTMTLAGTCTITNSTFEIAAGQFQGATDNSATLVTTGVGRVLWSGGWLHGTVTLAPNTEMQVLGTSSTVLGDGAMLNNQGNLRWFGTSPILANGYNAPSWINNAPGALFEIAADGRVFSASVGYHNLIFSNAPGARFVKTLGTDSVVDTCTLNNAGELRSDSGWLDFAGTLNLSDGTRFTGAGTNRLTGGTLALAGLTTIANSTLELAAGQSTGAADNSGTFATTGTGRLLWSGGWLYGTVTLTPKTELLVRGLSPTVMGDRAVLNNQGNCHWFGGSPIIASGYNAPSWFNNLPGALFEVAADGQVFGVNAGYWTLVFTNAPGARLVKTGGTNSWLTVCEFDNSGELRCDSGVLTWDATLNLYPGSTITGTGKARVVGGTVLVTGATTVTDSTLELAGGQGQGATDNSGLFLTPGTGRLLWSGTTLSRTLTFGTNAQVEFGTPATKLLEDGAVLENYGNTIWSDGILRAHGYNTTSYIRNHPGATFTITGTNAADQLTGYHVARVENQPGARLLWNTPGESAWTGWELVNDGLVCGLSGQLTLAAGGSASGLFTNVAGSELRFSAGSFSLQEGTRFRGNGVTRVNGATLTATGYVSAGSPGGAGSFVLDSGTLNGATFSSEGQFVWNGGLLGGSFSNAPAAVFTLAGGPNMVLGDNAVVFNRGSAQLTRAPLKYTGYNAIATWNNLPGGVFALATDGVAFGPTVGYQTLILNNSSGARLVKTTGTNTLVEQCVLNNTGELRCDSGTLSFGTTLNLSPGSLFTGSGRSELQSGQVTWNGLSTVQGTLNLSGAMVTGNSNAVVAASNGGLFDWSGGTVAGTLTLASGGKYQLSGSGTKVLDDWAVLNNAGTLSVSGTGRLSARTYNGPAVVNNLAGAVLRLTADTTWDRITGYQSAILTNSGTLALDFAPHLFQLNWDYAQSASGSLNVVLAGATPGAGYSQLAANSVTLSGGLNVSLASFNPTATNSFDVLSYGTRSGSFANTSWPALTGGQTWQATYAPNALTLAVIPPSLLSSPAFASNGHFQMQFNGPAAASAVLWASSDCRNWQPVATNAPFTGNFLFEDPQAASIPQRFYRVQLSTDP